MNKELYRGSLEEGLENIELLNGEKRYDAVVNNTQGSFVKGVYGAHKGTLKSELKVCRKEQDSRDLVVQISANGSLLTK